MLDEDEAIPEEQVAAFARCPNYPRDENGVLFLAQGLRKAATRHGLRMSAIVEECLTTSGYCPTDLDMMNVARSLAIGRGGQQACESRKPTKCPFELCDGSGWREVCHMWTHHGDSDGGPAWVEKGIITRDQYDALSKKVDWVKQAVYESRYRCKCHPPREVEEPKRKRA